VHLTRGIAMLRTTLVPGGLMALVVIALYGTARWVANGFVEDDRVEGALLLDAVGLIAATVVELPWFRLALTATAGNGEGRPRSMDIGEMAGRIVAMLVAATLFWAGILLGIR
jgi:hypothetical protein